jgi:hypothetical protein
MRRKRRGCKKRGTCGRKKFFGMINKGRKRTSIRRRRRYRTKRSKGLHAI